MSSATEESAHARNRFENRRLRKTMEHIAFTQRYAQTRIDDEIRSVRDNLRDIRQNTGHSSNMDSEGVRSFCRGRYVGSRQRRAAEQIERGECFDWTLTLDRDADTVRVPEVERHGHRSLTRNTAGVRRSVSLKHQDEGTSSTMTAVTSQADTDEEEGRTLRRSSSFHVTPSSSSRRASHRKPRQEQMQRTSSMRHRGETSVKRAESFQSVVGSQTLPGLKRSSSTQSLLSRSKGKYGGSVDRIEMVPIAQADLKQHGSSQHPSQKQQEPLRLPQISKPQPVQAETPHHSKRERTKGKRRVKARKGSDTTDIDLSDLVHEIVLDEAPSSNTGQRNSRIRERSSSIKRGKVKPGPKVVRPEPPMIAWAPHPTNETTLPALPGTDSRVHSSVSCPLPERQTLELPRTRKLSCPEEDQQTKLRMRTQSETDADDNVFESTEDASTSAHAKEEGEEEEPEVELSRYERRRKVLNARAAHSGMSLSEIMVKRQGDIKVAMSPRQLRRIREQIILQRSRRDYDPAAGEQVRFKNIEDRMRTFLEHEIQISEPGSGTDSYNSEEEGSLV